MINLGVFSSQFILNRHLHIYHAINNAAETISKLKTLTYSLWYKVFNCTLTALSSELIRDELIRDETGGLANFRYM